MAYTTEDLGRLIARAHYQAWRLDAPPFDLTPEELAAILPNLIKSGSAGIVWHRVKPVRERYGAMAYALEAATEAQIAHNQKVEEAVVECVSRLRAYGIEPVLVKGLALAKLYPEGIVRPAGDIDLVVRQEEFAAAHAILHDSSRYPIPIAIDLHSYDSWRDKPSQTLDQATSIPLMSTQATTLAAHSHLTTLIKHFFRHGATRPSRLVDIALLAELADNHKVAMYLITSDSRAIANWYCLGMQLAYELIGLPSEGQSTTRRIDPRLVAELTKRLVQPQYVSQPFLYELARRPIRTILNVGERIPDGISAAVDVNADINGDSSLVNVLKSLSYRTRTAAKEVMNG